jgi:hypothetical protein
MKQIIYIDGGAGRVIAAIPALLKYHKLNPNTAVTNSYFLTTIAKAWF